MREPTSAFSSGVSAYRSRWLRTLSRLAVIVRQSPQSAQHSSATREPLTPLSSPVTSCSWNSATVSRTSFSFSSMIWSFVSSSSASGTVAALTVSRCSSGISWHMRNEPTKTSSWRRFGSS